MPNRQEALARVRRAVKRRYAALKRKDWKAARSARAVANKYRKVAQRLRRSPKPKVKHTFTSAKRWFSRPSIKPDLIVLHSTESSAHSGYNVSDYLSRSSVQADSNLVIDTDGTTYRLVPDGRKAWTQAAFNSRSLSIEQVGRAVQQTWPDVQVRETAKWIAYWHKKYGIPIRDSRQDLKSGVVTHKALGQAGGGHVDPGSGFPFQRALALARTYK